MMINYGKQYIDKDDIDAVVDALTSDFITTGNKVDRFEQDLVDFCGSKYGICVSSGTSALMLCAKVLLQEGDEVLTTPNSFIATSNAILFANAKPVFVDIDKYGNINLDLCKKELDKNPKIKAIFATSFSGYMLNQEKLQSLKKEYDIKIVEDLAHSIGSQSGSIKAGSCANSDMSIFSFHPVKSITTGEGGAITTNSKQLYKKILSLRNHAKLDNENKPWEYEVKELSFNYRLSDINCALGISQLKKLPLFIEKRISIAKKYDDAFASTCINPLYIFDANSSYHLYVVKVNFALLDISREEFFKLIRDKDIALQVHYFPINKQPLYKGLGYGDEKTPIMDTYYNQCFSLPIYPSLSEQEQKYVINTLLNTLNTFTKDS